MILVDQAIWNYKGRRWAHLVSDSSFDELHIFAESLGLTRSMFQDDHYDIHHDLRQKAITLGAHAVDFRVLARALKEAGLRRR